MENAIDTLFGNGLFSNIHFVDENPAKIETIEVKKINSEIKEIKDVKTFKLQRYSIGKEGLPSLKIRENVKHSLIVRLNFDSSMSEMKYFNVGFFKKFFYKKDPKKILEAFNLRDWVITSEEIVSELSTLEEFVSLPGYSDVRLVGKIGETMIFKVKDLENVIYTGGKDSITAVFNRNLFDEEMGIEIEYLIQTNKDLTKIMVH
jgi:hypothetical protein